MQKEKKTMVKKINKEELEAIAIAYLTYLEGKIIFRSITSIKH